MRCWDMLISAIFISERLTDRVLPKEELNQLVVELTERNAGLGIRGAFLIANRHTAQIMEGPEAVVDDLVARILSDPRHHRGIVIERKPIDGYRFVDWRLVYRGSATYIDQKIATVLEKQDALAKADDTRELYDLMRLLARESSKQQGPIGNAPPS